MNEHFGPESGSDELGRCRQLVDHRYGDVNKDTHTAGMMSLTRNSSTILSIQVSVNLCSSSIAANPRAMICSPHQISRMVLDRIFELRILWQERPTISVLPTAAVSGDPR